MQYFNILIENLKASHISYFYDCQPLTCAPNSTSSTQAIDILLDLLESREALSVFHCLINLLCRRRPQGPH